VSDLDQTTGLKPETTAALGNRSPFLTILRGKKQGLTIELESARTIIGRGANAHIVLTDDIASRQHAEIVVVGEQPGLEYHIRDLSSTNGTVLNGRVITSQEPLKDGDRIRIGNHLLRFSLLDDVEAAALIKSRVASPGEHRDAAGSVEHLLCFPPFHMLTEVDLLYRDDCIVPLEPRAVRVLRYLVQNSERVVPKSELLEAIWPDVFTTDGVLKRAISHARRALHDDPKKAQYIETYNRRGYRFIAPVHRQVRHHK
jgi:DNA-binding winged helix-turn-helix (wHTH) protein